MKLPTPNPAERLRKFMADKDWNQQDFARKLGISPSGLSMFLRGERQLTPGMFFKLETITGISAAEWNKQTKEYAAWLASSERQESVNTEITAEDGLGSGVMNDTDILNAIKIGALKIEPFDDDLLQRASYDVRAGSIANADGDSVTIDTGGEFELGPEETAFVQCLEKITVFDRIIGHVSVPNSVAMEGIIVSHGSLIDPGYKGTLRAFLKNASSTPFKIIPGELIILSVEFVVLKTPPKRKYI